MRKTVTILVLGRSNRFCLFPGALSGFQVESILKIFLFTGVFRLEMYPMLS